MIKDCSIFSLMRIYENDVEAAKELIMRLNSYQLMLKSEEGQIDSNEIQKRLELFIHSNNKEELLQYLDSLENSIKVEELAKLLVLSGITDIDQNEFIDYMLKEAKTIRVVYACFRVLTFIGYNKFSSDLMITMKYYMGNLLLSKDAVEVFNGYDELQELYYNSLFDVEETHIHQIVLKYTLYRLLLPNGKALYERVLNLKNDINECNQVLNLYSYAEQDGDKEEFLNLIKKYNMPMRTYDLAMNCLHDFEEFLSTKSYYMTCIHWVRELIKEDIKQFPNAISLLMMLITFTTVGNVFAFAIGCFINFEYNVELTSLYDYLKDIAYGSDLLPMVLNALIDHPDYQDICYELAKNKNMDTSIEALNRLDISIPKNARIFIKKCQNTTVLSTSFSMVFEGLDYAAICYDPKATKLEIELVATGFSGISLNAKDSYMNYPNIVDSIEDFYHTFVRTKKYENHFMNVSLLKFSDIVMKINENDAQRIKDVVLSTVSFNKEKKYVEKELKKKDFNDMVLSAIMSYYRFCPVTELEETIMKNPLDHLVLLLTLIQFEDDPEQIRDYIDTVNLLMNVPKRYLNPKKHFILGTGKIDYYAEQLETISMLLMISPHYYQNLYRIGIQFSLEKIRFYFYQAIIELSKDQTIDDDFLYQQLQENYMIEQSEENMALLEEILKVQKFGIN